MRFQKGQIPWNKGTKGVLKAWNKGKRVPQIAGANNVNWRGNKVGYQGIHIWLNRWFGKANACENSECNKPSKHFEWAKLKDLPYERKRENFWMLCVSCHRKYDFNEELRIKLSESHKGQVAWNKGLKKAA